MSFTTDRIIEQLRHWGESQAAVDALLLTGSRVDPNRVVDPLSDYDIQLYVNDIAPYLADDWLAAFGRIMIRWPLKPASTLSRDWITRLVLFESRVRIDFQITSSGLIPASIIHSGYRVLVDKVGLARGLPEPDFFEYIITPPSRDEYEELVNRFFWDAVYVAKYLRRDEFFFARYMLDSVLRDECLAKLIEWYIGATRHWKVETGQHGRFFKRYLEASEWAAVEAVYSDAQPENNWAALYNMISLFRRLAQSLAERTGFNYALDLDNEITAYCEWIRTLDFNPDRNES